MSGFVVSRQRRTSLAVLVVLCSLLTGAGCTTTAAGAPTANPPAPSAPGGSASAGEQACFAQAQALSLKQQAGQLVMVGVAGTLDSGERKALKASQAGAVILMGNNFGSVSQVAKLTASIQKAGGGQLLIATDQEGGLVRRLRGAGFGAMPSAAQQAKLADAVLTTKATGWGSAMAKAGVRLDLAPVADVVPVANRKTNRPVALLGRGYGSDPASVSAKVAAFRAGMTAGGVATAVKHFPGLGAVRGNTDFATRVIDSTTTADSALLQPFRDASAGGADAVMISSAIYTKIDAKTVALFSPKVIGILRGWGYDKVVISDDLGVAAAVRGVPAKQRASRFVLAGGDLAITVNPALAASFTSGLVAQAKADPAFAAKMTASTARVLRLKQSLGLVQCG
jgi:beta-N-acetylhexosaminidase